MTTIAAVPPPFRPRCQPGYALWTACDPPLKPREGRGHTASAKVSAEVERSLRIPRIVWSIAEREGQAATTACTAVNNGAGEASKRIRSRLWLLPIVLFFRMPFLVPAVTALSSDVFVLWLGSAAPVGGTVFEEDHWVYHVSYLAVPLAVVRLFLLCLPLLFHSYTGTAVQHVRCYQAFYGATSLAVSVHAVALALMDPESLEAILPRIVSADLQHLHELRRIWWTLLLSALSVACHWVLLWHVRSTAPDALYSLLGGASGRQPTVYFAVRAASIQPDHQRQQRQPPEDEPPLIHAMNGAHAQRCHFVFLCNGLFFLRSSFGLIGFSYFFVACISRLLLRSLTAAAAVLIHFPITLTRQFQNRLFGGHAGSVAASQVGMGFQTRRL